MDRKVGKKSQSINSNNESLKEKLELQAQSAQIAQKLKNAHGITLVALVITIIIIIILATITMNMAFGDNGLIKQAQKAKDMAANSVIVEQEGMNSLMGEFANVMAEDSEIPVEPEKPSIPESTSYIGYYADVDGDKKPDGVIYADLAFSKSGEWADIDETYSYNAKTNLKEYYVSKEDYTGNFGTKDVLTVKEGSEGEERFYVMALEDVNQGNMYYWYYAAPGVMDDYATATSVDFGTGRANTIAMIKKWNSIGYGEQNANSTYDDMWGVIQTEVGDINNPTWFVPSKAEWSAFADNLGINEDNYPDYGLGDWYWSSSQCNPSNAWNVSFYFGYMIYGNMTDNLGFVRLSTTF